MFGVALVALGGMSLGLNFLLNFGAAAYGLDEKTQDYLRAGSASFFVVLVMAAFLFAIGDVVKLVWYYFFGREGEDGRD